MSNTKYLREILESVDVLNPERACERISEALQELRQVEAARAKDAERIEQLEALCRAVGNGLDEMMRPANMECDGAYCIGCWKDINGQLVKLLFAAGFKPSTP
jgi:hypothetical protein